MTKYLPPLNDGCEVHPHCLECPRIICKYDDPFYVNPETLEARIGPPQKTTQEAVATIVTMTLARARVQAIMAATGLSRRQVLRVRAREGLRG